MPTRHPEPSDRLTLRAARHMALAAQGLTAARKARRVDRRHVLGVVARTGLLQIDSVNVLARAHELPLFSRLGPYPTQLLYRLAYGPDRQLFEYWGHEASYLPVALQPLMRWRMARAETGQTWGGLARLARDRPEFVAAVLREVEQRGPVRAGDLDDATRVRRGTMWDWSDAKKALEWLFWTGRVSVASRTTSFERRYDLTERVLPAHVLALPTPTEEDAVRELLVRAAASHGVGTARDLADYYRVPISLARPRLHELVEDGRLRLVAVQGWGQPAYVHPQAVRARRAAGAALLAPFDPLVWERSRAERLFGFTYRIEIYVPAPQRRFGYYVLPFLLGDQLVARVDLKADRQAGLLRVPGAHVEAGVDAGEVAAALYAELGLMAEWLGLSDIDVAGAGDLAPALRLAAG